MIFKEKTNLSVKSVILNVKVRYKILFRANKVQEINKTFKQRWKNKEKICVYNISDKFILKKRSKTTLLKYQIKNPFIHEIKQNEWNTIILVS